jgi:hypothetical protein
MIRIPELYFLYIWRFQDIVLIKQITKFNFRDWSEHKEFQATSVLATVYTGDATLGRFLKSSGKEGLDFSLTLVISWGVELPYWFYPGFFIIQFQTSANNGAVAVSSILSFEPINIVLRQSTVLDTKNNDYLKPSETRNLPDLR